MVDGSCAFISLLAGQEPEGLGEGELRMILEPKFPSNFLLAVMGSVCEPGRS